MQHSTIWRRPATAITPHCTVGTSGARKIHHYQSHPASKEVGQHLTDSGEDDADEQVVEDVAADCDAEAADPEENREQDASHKAECVAEP
ncbi:hypothetical protein Mal48_45410 [Thalassoglobus polymorphus]|uniref:Uncharacterized protein n=1 Tax=Thalassoglobus polymorphus TaxID=2527994 RepID=A0A517QUH5_9PLAN|nr:hypothetical protein Mal48_45410 [Thalassoglobus polymorphus]